MLVIATKNAGKMREFRRILPTMEMQSMLDAGITEEIEENGKTFEENALIKAQAVCKKSGMVAVADDSGLCVDALDGAPGIYSARYAGASATDAERVEKLLKALENTEEERRGAAFVCAVALVTPSGEEHVFVGRCRGIITRAARGANGLGYDPVFLVQEEGRTFAELDGAVKDKISHRAIALSKLKLFLEERENRPIE